MQEGEFSTILETYLFLISSPFRPVLELASWTLQHAKDQQKQRHYIRLGVRPSPQCCMSHDRSLGRLKLGMEVKGTYHESTSSQGYGDHIGPLWARGFPALFFCGPQCGVSHGLGLGLLTLGMEVKGAYQESTSSQGDGLHVGSLHSHGLPALFFCGDPVLHATNSSSEDLDLLSHSHPQYALCFHSLGAFLLPTQQFLKLRSTTVHVLVLPCIT